MSRKPEVLSRRPVRARDLTAWIVCSCAATLVLLASRPPQADGGERVAAELATRDAQGDTAWYSLEHLDVEGKGWSDTQAFYDRLPARAEGLVRPPVWSLSRHSAGLCVRFITDASSLSARWTLTSSRLEMNHMPATGVSGLDLYVRTGSGWHWAAVGRPTAQENRVTLLRGLPKERREFLLYLPLYNGVASVEIGLPAAAQLEKGDAYPAGQTRPLVFWGTSITQGGCASRTGMVHTAILGRRLNRPVINLGFSGNGRMEPEVARLISELDAAVFIIDCLPNLTPDLVAERVRPMVDILREQCPETPILLVEDRTYADAFLVESRARRNQGSRRALRTAYETMQADGLQHLYYLEGETLLGKDGLDTVDGSHPTDLGFWRQANAFEPILRTILQSDQASGQ